jgi:hypothetical protein
MTQVVSFIDFTPAAWFDVVPWTQADVEEAAGPTGPWTLIDTLTLDPVDSDPADPRKRNLTTENASDLPGLWYRLIFEDGDGNTGQPSTPIQNVTPAAPAAQFATSDEFADRIGLTLDDAEKTRVDRLLGLASALIQDEAKQTISLVTDDALVMPGTTDELIKLPQRPVVSITSVTLDGVTLTEGSDWYLDGNAIVRRTILLSAAIGILDGPFLLGTGFGYPNQTLEITYSHGYAAIPDAVKAICLEATVRVWVNPGAVARESEGDTSTLYHHAPDQAGLLLSVAEQRVIRRMFGRNARSITVGR